MAESSGRKFVDIGLLVLRVGIGVIFICHGWPKLIGGPDKWAGVGGMGMAALGITRSLEFWGFMAAFSECIGGAALVLGFFTRIFAFLMMLTMAAATAYMILKAQPPASFSGWSHPLSMAIVFLSLVLLGGGKFNIMTLFKSGGGGGGK